LIFLLSSIFLSVNKTPAQADFSNAISYIIQKNTEIKVLLIEKLKSKYKICVD